MKKNYNIKIHNGKKLCNFTFEWVNEKGVKEKIETEDMETAQTIINLLSGETCLADLEP